jgi:hypothetical protein
MKTLFAILYSSEYLKEDIEILKEYLNNEEKEFDQLVFFLKKKNGKARTLLTKEFGKYLEEFPIFEEYIEETVEETIQLYIEDLHADDYVIIVDGISDDVFSEEEPIQIEEL